jgi:hypothetical protein
MIGYLLDTQQLQELHSNDKACSGNIRQVQEDGKHLLFPVICGLDDQPVARCRVYVKMQYQTDPSVWDLMINLSDLNKLEKVET